MDAVKNKIVRDEKGKPTGEVESGEVDTTSTGPIETSAPGLTSSSPGSAPVEKPIGNNPQGKRMQPTHDELKHGFFHAANHILEASKLIKPFNGLLALSMVKQAEFLLEQLGEFDSASQQSCSTSNQPEVPEKVKEEIDILVAELDGILGEL